MYIHVNLHRILGHPRNFCVCTFLKILMVSDKTIHKAFRIRVHKSYPGIKKKKY